MIVSKELNPHNYPTSDEIAKNLSILLERINKIRTAYGKIMVVTSGLRSDADQARINPKAPKSNHLKGLAVDISDPDGSLNAWCKANVKLLEEVGLWLEERQGNWQHFQCVAPKSGNRFFNP